MLIRVAMSSESSNSCLRAITGISIVSTRLSTAISTMLTALANGSTDPPRFRAPTTTRPPFVLFSISPLQSAISAGSPSSIPFDRYPLNEAARKTRVAVDLYLQRVQLPEYTSFAQRT